MNIKPLIMIFLIIIVGISLLTPIADMIWSNTNTIQQLNESLDISTAKLADNSINSNIKFSLGGGRNISAVNEVRYENGTVLALTTDYTVDLTTGTISFVNSTTNIRTTTTNNTDVDYVFRPAEYVDDTISRTIISLVIIFFVIAILLFVIAWLRGTTIFELFKK